MARLRYLRLSASSTSTTPATHPGSSTARLPSCSPRRRPPSNTTYRCAGASLAAPALARSHASCSRRQARLLVRRSGAGLTTSDIDVWEINEAAAVVLRFCDELNLTLDQVNRCGGAIARCHPLGDTGAKLLGTALDELERTGGRYACIALCVGAGQGTATVIERCS